MEPENPYAAPKASIVAPRSSAVLATTTIARCPVRHGARWLLSGFGLLFRWPATWVLVGLLFAAANLLQNLLVYFLPLPIIGTIISGFLLAALSTLLSAGVIAACLQQQFKFGEVINAIFRRLGPLFALSIIIFLLFVILGMFFGFIAAALRRFYRRALTARRIRRHLRYVSSVQPGHHADLFCARSYRQHRSGATCVPVIVIYRLPQKCLAATSSDGAGLHELFRHPDHHGHIRRHFYGFDQFRWHCVVLAVDHGGVGTRHNSGDAGNLSGLGLSVCRVARYFFRRE